MRSLGKNGTSVGTWKSSWEGLRGSWAVLRGSWEGLRGSFNGSNYGVGWGRECFRGGWVGSKDLFYYFDLEVLVKSFYRM